MSKNSQPNNRPTSPTTTRFTRDNGGGAPGPKYTIPCPPPKKK